MNTIMLEMKEMFVIFFFFLKDKSKVRGDFWHDFR